MLIRVLAICAAVLLGASGAQSASVDGQETYELLFRKGTLDDIGGGATLRYNRAVENGFAPDAAERATGDIVLRFREPEKVAALLEFRQGDKHRGMGSFPASVGNPMIMVFYEQVIRDMAESAGGSPFYIRNRVKEALVQPSEVEEGEAVVDGETVATKTIRMRPFDGDPNAGSMQGFGDLELAVTMSDAVPGWYLSLVAQAPNAEGGAGYRSVLSYEGMEAAE